MAKKTLIKEQLLRDLRAIANLATKVDGKYPKTTTDAINKAIKNGEAFLTKTLKVEDKQVSVLIKLTVSDDVPIVE